MRSAVFLEPVLPKLVLLFEVQEQLPEEAEHFKDGPPLSRLDLQATKTQVVQKVSEEVTFFVDHFETEFVVDDAS